MNIREYVLLFLLSLGLISFGVFVRFQYNWPDFVHTNYGFPFVWATHTTVTIAGPADKWNVDLFNLFFNIATWLFISFFAYTTYLWVVGKQHR